MGTYTRINFTVSSSVDKEIKKAAKEKGLSLSEYCRQRLSENLEPEELDRVSLESRIEDLEKVTSKLAYRNLFLSRYIFHFMAFLKDEEFANIAWKAALDELKQRE